MLNYLKSEFFRVRHTAGAWITAVIFTLLGLVVNIGIYVFLTRGYNTASEFPLITDYSYGVILQAPMVFVAAALAIIVGLYDRQGKIQSVNLAVACGLSRGEMLLGQIIVSVVCGLVSMVIVMAVFLGSAMLLFEPGDPLVLRGLLELIPVIMPSVLAAIILYVSLSMCLRQSAIVCFVLVFMLPNILEQFAIGFNITWLLKLVDWIPNVTFSNLFVPGEHYMMIWQSPEGLVQCLGAGGIGIVLFGLFAAYTAKKGAIK